MGIDFEKRPGINLNKLSGRAANEGMGVAMDNKSEGLITAKLRWRQGMGRGKSDLDLFGWVVGAGTKGRKGGLKGLIGGSSAEMAEVIYHKNLGSLAWPPYVEHGGDSRVPGEETIRIGALDKVKYVMFGVYQAFGNGAGSLKSFDAHVVVTDTEGNEVKVELAQSHPNRYWATIALVDLTNPKGYVIKPVEEYSRAGTEKSPTLNSHGKITMNEGPTYMVKGGQS